MTVLLIILSILAGIGFGMKLSADFPHVAYWLTLKRWVTDWKPCAKCIAFWVALAIFYFEAWPFAVAGTALLLTPMKREP